MIHQLIDKVCETTRLQLDDFLHMGKNTVKKVELGNKKAPKSYEW